MLKYLLLGSLAIVSAFQLTASNLEIKNIRGLNRGDVGNHPAGVIFDIRWENSWYNAKNHDAAWIFLKFNDVWDSHAKLMPQSIRILQNRSGSTLQPKVDMSSDSLGFFIYPSTPYRGEIDLKIMVSLDTSSQEITWRKINGLKVHGIEMVYSPKGPFSLGSPDEPAIKRAALYRSDASGNRAGPFTINSEKSISIAPKRDSLYYWSEEPLYNGDQKGFLSESFPKGYQGFYIMKYELTQGQYAAFLNNIPQNWTYIRSPMGGKKYYESRGCIIIKNGKYLAEHPHRPMNFVSFTDGLAYTDWAALRPITELEYEKAARGPEAPKPFEFVWGTDHYDHLERYVEEGGNLVFSNGVSESALNDENRPTYGASYYWVMDLSGSVWEKVITIGNSKGRSFRGSHGDGTLSFGKATNEDWPTSDDEEGGFGYRGGGYYETGTPYSDFNPHSPIGYRYYGAWSGGPRYIAYGYRAGRSAPAE